jgi:hypothetical protein
MKSGSNNTRSSRWLRPATTDPVAVASPNWAGDDPKCRYVRAAVAILDALCRAVLCGERERGSADAVLSE